MDYDLWILIGNFKKVVQVTAHELGIPVEMVQVQATNTVTNANGSVTGGSMTSELVCYVS